MTRECCGPEKAARPALGVTLTTLGGVAPLLITTVCVYEVLAAKPAAPLQAAVTGWLPTDRVVVEKTAWPPERATLEPPGIATPLSRKVTVPRLPGDGATV